MIASQSFAATRATNCAALLAGEVLAGGGQDPGLGIDLQPLAAELLEHVVRDHDRGLADHPEPPQLAGADHHLRGLAGADLVKQADGRLGEDPRDGGALMRSRRERAREPGQREPLAVGAVVAQHERVEPLVVLAGEPRARARGPPSTTRAKRSCSASAFSCAAAVSVGLRTRGAIAVVDLVGDLHRPLLQHRLGDRQRRRSGRCPTRWRP